MNDPLAPLAASHEQQMQRRKARLTFMAIVGVFVLPFIVMPLVVSIDQLGKNNKGLLIQPHIPIAELKLEKMDGQIFNVDDLQSRWTIVYVVPHECRDDCIQARDHAMYAMRQVRLSMDRQIDRVHQLLIFTEAPDAELNSLIAREFSGMSQAKGPREVLTRVLGNSGSAAGKIFLMSPDGYIFMSYPTIVDEAESILRARDIRADLKKSLKGDRRS